MLRAKRTAAPPPRAAGAHAKHRRRRRSFVEYKASGVSFIYWRLRIYCFNPKISFKLCFKSSNLACSIFPILFFMRLLSIALNWNTRATETTLRLLRLSGSIIKVKGKSTARSLEELHR